MPDIEIKETSEIDNGWEFRVVVQEGNTKTEHRITLDHGYWEMLTTDKGNPEDLVRRSFEFLLSREPKESILHEFNLREISRYFPEYKKEIKKRLP